MIMTLRKIIQKKRQDRKQRVYQRYLINLINNRETLRRIANIPLQPISNNMSQNYFFRGSPF